MCTDNKTNFFKIEPEINHPGVVDMDATYSMIITDNDGKIQGLEKVILKCDDANVIIDGFEVTIPYELRKNQKGPTITVYAKDDMSLYGSYEFEFISFSEEPTLFDDFDYDSGLWKTGWFKDLGGGIIENSNMVLTVGEDGKGKIVSTDKTFEQAYGCFSSRIKMPDRNANVNCAFWLCTYKCYKRNPQCESCSGGEIDLVELLPPANMYLASVHWFGWGEYHKCVTHSEALCFDQTEYNVYSTVWTPKALYWYVNGDLRYVYEGDGVVEDSAPMVVLLQNNPYKKDNAMGWITTPKPAKTASVYYDWVKIHSIVKD